jgi:DNA-binding MarR family transcriptional regulator
MAVMRRVSGLPLDGLALAVMSNIWRTAQAFKQETERRALREERLSFAAFSTLFIVWVWGPIETRAIARSQSVSRATVTSTVTMLERRGLAARRTSAEDRRLVLVELTQKGRTLIERLFPRFNRAERSVAAALSEREQKTLVRLLRKMQAAMRARETQEAGASGDGVRRVRAQHA